MLEEFATYGSELLLRVTSRWWKSPALLSVLGFFFGIFADMKVYIMCISLLVLIDMITGLMASLHRGEKFNSRKLRMGLVERAILYGLLFIITLAIDIMLRGTIDYGKDYIAITCCTMIGFYEAGSCVENLVSRFPKYTFLKKIGKLLNIMDKRFQDNTINMVEKTMKDERER